jgi:preprotein translocase subunit YajC
MIVASPFALLLQAAPPAGGGSALTGLLFQFVAIIAIIYFVMVRPQQRQRKQHEQSLGALKKGDEVVTAGGIVGTVVHIRETGKEGASKMDDRVTIRSDESRMIVERRGIAKVLTSAAAPAAAS